MKTILLLKYSLCLFFLSFFCLGAASSLYEENYNHVIRIGEQYFVAEFADTPEKMQRGMMHRPRMEDKQAMLFAYPRPQQASFWMKNTLIPLDMLFFNEEGQLVEIKHNVPPCNIAPCPIYRSKSQAIQYIVELQGGVSNRLQIPIGSLLALVNQ